MFVFVSRGKGHYVPLFMLASFVFVFPFEAPSLVVRQSLMLAWIVTAGAFIAVYGYLGLRAAEKERGVPLAAYEWLLDPPWKLNAPFHSFMYIQMPWWALGYGAVAFYLARLILEGSPA